MKNIRHQTILQLIKDRPVLTQDELQSLLLRAGFKVTQSTVSRDIKQLRIVKALDDAGNYRYTNPREDSHSSSTSPQVCIDTYKSSVISVDFALNNVVVKCIPGMASGACVAIDTLFSDHLLGSLAGEDTIFIVTKNEEESIFLVKKLKELI